MHGRQRWWMRCEYCCTRCSTQLQCRASRQELLRSASRRRRQHPSLTLARMLKQQQMQWRFPYRWRRRPTVLVAVPLLRIRRRWMCRRQPAPPPVLSALRDDGRRCYCGRRAMRWPHAVRSGSMGMLSRSAGREVDGPVCSSCVCDVLGDFLLAGVPHLISALFVLSQTKRFQPRARACTHTHPTAPHTIPSPLLAICVEISSPCNPPLAASPSGVHNNNPPAFEWRHIPVSRYGAGRSQSEAA